MIKGIGVDIIEIDRIGLAVSRTTNFLQKIFTEKEQAYFKSKNNSIETIAGSFAAKEAVSKALGTGFRGFTLTDIEILRDDLGKPFVNINKKISDKFAVDNSKIKLSISHNKSNAIAYVIIEE